MWLVALTFRVLLGLVGVGLMLHATWTNAHFWYVRYAGEWVTQLEFTAASLICDALKLLIPALCAAYGISLWKRKDAAAVFLLAFGISLVSGIGYLQMTQETAAAGGQAIAAQRAKLLADIRQLEDKLALVPASRRTLPQVKAALAEAEARAPKTAKGEACTTRTGSRDGACDAVFAYRAELASEEARAALMLELAPLSEALVQLPTTQNVESELMVLLRSVIRLLLIELCPAAIAIFVLTPPPMPPASTRLEPPKRTSRPHASGLLKPSGGLPAASYRWAIADSVPRAAGSDLLELLRTAQPGPDGWVITTQRVLAESLLVSPAEVNRQLAGLVRRGLVTKRSGRNGTALKVLPSGSVVPLRA